MPSTLTPWWIELLNGDCSFSKGRKRGRVGEGREKNQVNKLAEMNLNQFVLCATFPSGKEWATGNPGIAQVAAGVPSKTAPCRLAWC